jgi:Fatty-acid desaturase
MPERAKPMGDVSRTVSTDSGRAYDPHPIIGAAVAVMVAALYGQPTHVMVTTPLLLVMTGLGVTAGYHRLFAHHSFATFRSVERALMILGCMASCAPFFWVAIHRAHHRHSDRDGDPHSPHIWAGRRLGIFRGCWHSYFEWHHSCYQAPAVRDLTCRPDLVWIDRHWFLFYLVGLAIPGLVGFVIGGTTYDALLGFLWGGLFRRFIGLQMPHVVNTVCHLWGTRPYETHDHSRNNFLLGVLAMGDGWHNNHHAFPYSARHGFRWWQFDLTWYVIWLMEGIGLAWDVKRPRFSGGSDVLPERTAA